MKAVLKNWNYNILGLPFGEQICIYVLTQTGQVLEAQAFVWEEFTRCIDSEGNAETCKRLKIQNMEDGKTIEEYDVQAWKFK